jgi:beta-phosphoglucomutase
VIKAVVFDLDGVITDSTGYHLLSWQQAAAEKGFELDPEIHEQLKGLTRQASLDVILGSQKRQFSEQEKASILQRKQECYQEFVQHMTVRDMLPGAEQLLRQIKAQGRRLGVASASKNASLILERLSLRPLFDAVVDGNQITRSKPDPEVYTKALDLLCVGPFEAVAVEDAAAGVSAAKAAGIWCVGVGSVEYLAEADLVVESIAQLSVDDLLGLGE